MAYNKFTLKDLKTDFQLSVSNQHWLSSALPEIERDEFLLRLLNEAQTEALSTEKARSEFIIAPVLKALRRHNHNRFSFYSGYQFDVDRKLKLTGFCDFILSLVPDSPLIEAPVFCVIEAKKEDIDNRALAQCGAEMYAARLFNENEGHPKKVIYGCVTTAFLWCFLKLENSQLLIDPVYVPLTFDEPERVLAVLQWIVDDCLKQ